MGWWYELMHPEIFQGARKKAPYFEGWYFKLVSSNERHAVSLIPGISLGEDSHAFLQVIDGKACRSEYWRFDLDEFEPDHKLLKFQLGPHFFSSEEIILRDEKLSGHIQIVDPVPWSSSILRPGIMGWYSYMPFMQCYHGLVSANHALQGQLMHQGNELDFSDGKGYIEKDWGRSFPRSWIWMQCNNFHNDEDVSVMASVAHIPWLGTHFIGFLAIIWYRHELKVFTSYTGARYTADINEEEVMLSFSDSKSCLKIRAEQAPGAELLSPLQGNMTGKVNESLDARLQIIYQIGREVVLHTDGSTAGLEVAGQVDELLTV